MNIDQLTAAKLSLSPGDVLAVMVPTILSREQRDRPVEHLTGRLPAGVKPMIFDGGIIIAQITAHEKP